MSETPVQRRSIHIMLDARTLHRPHRRGIGKTLASLYERVLAVNPGWRVTGCHRGPHPQGLDSPGYRPRALGCPGDRFDAWRRWRLPLAAWRDRADLLHLPANLATPWMPAPAIVTVHDLLPMRFDDGTARRLDASIRRCVRRRLTILTPSRFTADQIIQTYLADPKRVVVAPWAADPAMTPTPDPATREAVARRYGVPGPFVLHLGAPDPRKNTARVIEAFAALPPKLRNTWSLLIVGLADPGHRERLAEQCHQLGAGASVKLHGFADEADMPALFSAAEALLYPSRGEGFGLPILDAFATDTAVLTSPNTSLTEVGGDAVVYADADDADAITDRLRWLLEDDAARRRLAGRGRQRGSTFTWAATADRFVAAVETTLGIATEAARDAA